MIEATDSGPPVEIVKLEKAIKTYQMGTQEVRALAGVDVSFEKGGFWAIMGPSGSVSYTHLTLPTN